MNVYQLKHYGNNNYNSFFDVINEYSNKNSINTNSYIKKFFNMKFNVYENIKNNKESYVRQFDKYVYLKHDKNNEIKNKWLHWWKDQLVYSKYPFTWLPTSSLLRLSSNFQNKNNESNYFNTKVTKDSVNSNTKDENTKYYITKWNNSKYIDEESIIINTFDFILSKSYVSDLKNKHNDNSQCSNKICNNCCCKNIFNNNSFDCRNRNYYNSNVNNNTHQSPSTGSCRTNNNNNTFNINQMNNKRKYLNIENINTKAKINNSIYYKPNNKLKRLYDNRFYLKNSNKLINTTTTTAQIEIENIINETL